MKDILYNSLKRLSREGGNHNFVIIKLSRQYYIQIACEFGSNHFLFEAVSNYYLSIRKQLSTTLQEAIVDLGWKIPEGKGNYSIETDINLDEDYTFYIDLIRNTAKEIYGIDNIQEDMIDVYLE